MFVAASVRHLVPQDTALLGSHEVQYRGLSEGSSNLILFLNIQAYNVGCVDRMPETNGVFTSFVCDFINKFPDFACLRS